MHDVHCCYEVITTGCILQPSCHITAHRVIWAYKDFNDSLNTKVKLNLYKSFCKEIEFKNYLQGVGDPGTRLLFKFRSGTNGLNEELGRHRGKNDDRQCKLCRGECESVVHVLWECPAYDSIRK